jgi:hypothetical protein
MSIILENKIMIDQRFAKKNKKEYHVFSSEIEDASVIEKWVGIHEPFKVLMDPKTFQKLRNKRLRWTFDDDNILTHVNVLPTNQKK